MAVNTELEEQVTREWLERTQLARDLASWLIIYRTKHNLTQTQMAEHLGVKQSVVSAMEGGARAPSVSRLQRIAAATGEVLVLEIDAQGARLKSGK